MTQRTRDNLGFALLLLIIYTLAFIIGYVTEVHAQEEENDQPCKIIAVGQLSEVTHSLSPTFWIGDKAMNPATGESRYPPAISVEETSVSYTLLKEFSGEIVELCVRRPRKLARIVRW